MAEKGVIFDIHEFALFDGPGIRTTVFFKGCPLTCNWCHNPEGLSFKQQLMVSFGGCTHCGNCFTSCPLSETSPVVRKNIQGIPFDCNLCGICLGTCPLGLRRIVGEEYNAEKLAEKLLRNASYLRCTGGGYTFSGGEPTGQGDFLLDILVRLRGNHRAIETCGFCEGELFQAVMEEIDLIIMDIKIADTALHKRYTGQDNGPILANLERLKAGRKPFVIRIPLISGITDTDENLYNIATLCFGKTPPEKVELLPYHKTAGAKYTMLGMEYKPQFDTDRQVNTETRYFSDRNIPCSIL
jgi:pyruvate formate lyase activating enzyme